MNARFSRLLALSAMLLSMAHSGRAAEKVLLRYRAPEKPLTRRYELRSLFQATASQGKTVDRKVMSTGQSLVVRASAVKGRAKLLELAQRSGTGWVRLGAKAPRQAVKAGKKGMRVVDLRGRVVKGPRDELGLVFPEKAASPGKTWKVVLPKAPGRPFAENYRFSFVKMEKLGRRSVARIEVAMRGRWSFRKPPKDGAKAEVVVLDKLYKGTLHFDVAEGAIVRQRIRRRTTMTFPDRGKRHYLRQDFRLSRNLVD